METYAKASDPLAYSILDNYDPEAKFATDASRMITANCRSPEGIVNPEKLRRILDMVINLVGNETGVLPTVATTPAISDPPNDNPRNPHEWDWAAWSRLHLKQKGGSSSF